MYWPFRTTHPPKVKYFFKSYCSLLSLLVCMYWPSSTTTPSQSEIFSVIVTCSYVLAFQDQTPSQSEIFFQICYCRLLSLLVCMYWPSITSTPSQSEIFFTGILLLLLSNERELLMEANINISHTVKLTVSLFGRM